MPFEMIHFRDSDKIIRRKKLAGVVRPEYEGDGITWFIVGEQPWHGAFSISGARRAAEKALGFPDGLVIPET